MEHVSFRGPIPPPHILKQYYDIDPEFVRWILASSDAESARRAEREMRLISWLGFTAMAVVIGAYALALAFVAGLVALAIWAPDAVMRIASAVTAFAAFGGLMYKVIRGQKTPPPKP